MKKPLSNIEQVQYSILTFGYGMIELKSKLKKRCTTLLKKGNTNKNNKMFQL